MSKPSYNMRPVLKLCEYPPLGQVLTPLLNVERDEIGFKQIDYKSLAPELKTAMSWVFHLFCDCSPDEETWGYVDPFEGLNGCSTELKKKIVQALGVRYGLDIKNLVDKSGFNNGPRIVGLLFERSGLAEVFKTYQSHGVIDWNEIRYGALPGGFQTGVSWSYSIWNHKLPENLGFRNPINNFGVMDQELQAYIIQAFALSLGLEIS